MKYNDLLVSIYVQITIYSIFTVNLMTSHNTVLLQLLQNVCLYQYSIQQQVKV